MFNGILVFNKPKDYTSHDIIAKLRGITKQRQIGHGGTLDPMATGVLPVFFGNATKASEYSIASKKQYVVAMRLGVVTDTQDITGSVIRTNPVNVSEEMIKTAIANFIGEIYQLPPMYSAIHVDGKRLYDLARQGIEVERDKRKITIYDISYDGKNSDGDFLLTVTCSKGTYIRTLCSDIGDSLGCGATITMLKRIYTGGFGIDLAVDFDTVINFAKDGKFQNLLIPTDKIFCELPCVILNDRLTALVKHGVRIREGQLDMPLPKGHDMCRVYDINGTFLMLGKMISDGASERVMSIEKTFAAL